MEIKKDRKGKEKRARTKREEKGRKDEKDGACETGK